MITTVLSFFVFHRGLATHLAPATAAKGDMSKSVAGVTGNFEALGDMDFSWRWMRMVAMAAPGRETIQIPK